MIRLLLTTIILTMLAQPVWAEDQLDQNEIREIIATTINEGVASALASCLTQENADTEDDPYCSCALKYRDVKMEAGFKVLYEDCTAPLLASIPAESIALRPVRIIAGVHLLVHYIAVNRRFWLPEVTKALDQIINKPII